MPKHLITAVIHDGAVRTENCDLPVRAIWHADALIQWINARGERPSPVAEGSAVVKTWFKIPSGESERPRPMAEGSAVVQEFTLATSLCRAPQAGLADAGGAVIILKRQENSSPTVRGWIMTGQDRPATADTAITSADLEEIRALFLRQAAGETAHDIDAIDAVLARAPVGEPDPVNFVARAYRFWGREAVLDHFHTIFAGTWRFEPDESAMRVIPMGADVAHIYAPTRITVGAAGQPAATYQFHINEFAIRTPQGWRISAIVPVPAQ